MHLVITSVFAKSPVVVPFSITKNVPSKEEPEFESAGLEERTGKKY